MAKTQTVDPQVQQELLEAYRQMMWLARQPFVTHSMARAWFTHIVAGRLARRIRTFTGKVSERAAKDPSATLRLEHYRRIQTSITQLVRRHATLKSQRPDEFVKLVLQCERVHIVTFHENYEAMKANGNYRKAGITLRNWDSLPQKSRQALWNKMLRGRVANAAKFDPSR